MIELRPVHEHQVLSRPAPAHIEPTLKFIEGSYARQTLQRTHNISFTHKLRGGPQGPGFELQGTDVNLVVWELPKRSHHHRIPM